MFGMLDYRAHKLFWLVGMPFRILVRLTYFVLIFFAIVIAERTSYNPGLKIVVAYAAWEVMTTISNFIWRRIGRLVDRIFFWFIDVVPAHGIDAAEAHAIVLYGRLFELNKKLLTTGVENWTTEDTEELVPLMWNWRARYLYPGKERLERRAKIIAAELQRIHMETGQQPDLQPASTMKLLDKFPGERATRLERIKTQLVSGPAFYSVIAFALIVLNFWDDFKAWMAG